MSFRSTKNPHGGAASKRVVEGKHLEQPTVKQVVSMENVQQAWKRVKANKGVPGVDGITILDFPAQFKVNWAGVRQSLLDGTYIPGPVLRAEIPKDTGGTRPLGIPTVSDRVIQQAITQVLTPIFDPYFSDSSYGYRPGRSAHQAVRKVIELIKGGYTYAVDIDLAKFFDTVNHDILMSRVSRRIKDKGILKLIGRYLRSGVVIDGRLHRTNKGVPQGGPLSPLLSNILLDDLDLELKKRGHQFARYADDLIILVKSKRAGERVMASISRFLENILKVQVNRDKSKVAKAVESIFLSFTFTAKKLTVSEKSLTALKSQLRAYTGRSWGVSMEYRLGKIAAYLRGWINYFGIGMKYNDAVELDHWLRRRIRMCYWKQWRRSRKRIRELIKLGASKHQAILTGLSRKGYWHLAKTLATNSGLSNDYLQKQGLISLRTLWIGIHHPATAR